MRLDGLTYLNPLNYSTLETSTLPVKILEIFK